MSTSRLRKLACVLSACAVLTSGLGIDTAYARGGGGFGGGHAGFEAGHIGGFGRSMAGGSGGIATGPTNFTGLFGRSSGGGSGGRPGGSTNFQLLGSSTSAGSGGQATGSTNPVRPQYGGGHTGSELGVGHASGGFGEDHMGVLAGVHPGTPDFGSGPQRRWRGDSATRLLCEDAIMVDPACGNSAPSAELGDTM
jgi:hypothetical protein